jgi:hypothetical protein
MTSATDPQVLMITGGTPSQSYLRNTMSDFGRTNTESALYAYNYSEQSPTSPSKYSSN